MNGSAGGAASEEPSGGLPAGRGTIGARLYSYAGRHAQLYDLFYSEKEYGREAEFVHQCLRAHGMPDSKRMLELACGTGSHALLFERLGYDVTAIDSSPDMIACARDKAVRNDSRVLFHLDDMRSLSAPTERFGAVICLFDSIGYVLTNEAIVATFRNVVANLEPGGLFVFDFWHASAMLRGYEPLRVRTWTTDEGDVVRTSRTQLDCAAQVAHVHYTILELRGARTWNMFEEEQSNRFFLVQEMRALLALAGLSDLAFYGGFQRDEIITPDSWHIVCVARPR